MGPFDCGEVISPAPWVAMPDGLWVDVHACDEYGDHVKLYNARCIPVINGQAEFPFLSIPHLVCCRLVFTARRWCPSMQDFVQAPEIPPQTTAAFTVRAPPRKSAAVHRDRLAWLARRNHIQLDGHSLRYKPALLKPLFRALYRHPLFGCKADSFERGLRNRGWCLQRSTHGHHNQVKEWWFTGK